VLSVLRQLLITDVVSGFDVSEEAGPALPVVLPRDFTLLTRTYDDLDRAAQQYLLDRGITKEQIRENHLGISYSGRYAYRILFPVYVAKTLKGIVARDFTGCQKPKYLNSPGEKYLYHFNPAVETCIFSEGVFKALRIQQATLCGSAALLGHDLTSAQISQIIGSRCKRVIFYPDPDRVGRRGVVSMADKLIEAWGGEIKIICKVFRPADEDELSNIKKNLTNAVAYGWDVRQRTLLQS
jgi:DNA primase